MRTKKKIHIIINYSSKVLSMWSTSVSKYVALHWRLHGLKGVDESTSKYVLMKHRIVTMEDFDTELCNEIFLLFQLFEIGYYSILLILTDYLKVILKLCYLTSRWKNIFPTTINLRRSLLNRVIPCRRNFDISIPLRWSCASTQLNMVLNR